MVKLIDTHAHIYVAEIEDRNQLMEEALINDVGHIIMPNIDLESVALMKSMNQQFSKNTSILMGLHPCSVADDYETQLASINAQIPDMQIVGIGEIGLDFYWSITHKKEQINALEIQLQWAIDNNLPVSLHTREATTDTIAICKNFTGLKGVFHCFGGSLAEANEIIGMGMSLGLGGVLTFKNSGLDEVVKDIDLIHLVLETDTPYLAPHPFRGKQNAPKYLRQIAEKLALVKGIDYEEVAAKTTQNAQKIFNIA